ncbi:hypothetical protein AB0L40_18420 [Patulibacter sp. NPDC049589]|uniref:hypothetical protein n=1 Tax=Patulibacter sp. NPDC049589 TaxID=3154731 RepID=UPI003417D682
MGFFKQVATAMRPSNIVKGLDAARNPPDQAAIEAGLASLTPEQRAAYDANMARVAEAQVASQASWEEARAIHDEARILGGPAGRYLHGAGMGDLASPDELQARIAEVGPLAAINEQRALRKGEFRDGVRQALNRERVARIDDPGERAAAAVEELRARDEARSPYRAADAPVVVVTRLSARGDGQLAAVLEHLSASGPAADRVFGIHRVPDRISQTRTPHSERGRVVEWAVVHEGEGTSRVAAVPGAADPGAAGQSSGPAGESADAGRPVATSFAAHEQWVARRAGEPSVLDEEVGLAYCAEAGIGPERCFGLARFSEFRALRGGEEHDAIRTLVRGLVVVHPDVGPERFARMQAAAPLAPLRADDVHLEVLNWSAVADAQHPRIHHPPPVPSPFPYLPGTPEELLRAYLEVVGVRATDCYAAQATVDRPRELRQGGLLTTNTGPEQPCADGRGRMRTHGAEQVVIAYRDAPAYAAGRERWLAYQRDVLLADLRKGTGARRPVVVPDDEDLAGLPKLLRAAVRVGEAIDALEDWGGEALPPYRYCWPPVA